MSWSAKRIFGTVKFKIALWYATLFAVSWAVCLLIAFLMMRHGLLLSVDQRLAADSRELVHEYLTGKRYRQFDREVPLEQVSPEELAAFKARVPGIKLLTAFEMDTPRERFFTVFGGKESSVYELRLESGGSVYSRRIDPQNHVQSLLKTFEDRVTGEGSRNVLFRLISPDGRVLGATPESARLLPAGVDGVNYRIQAVRGEDFRILRLPLFDGGVLEFGRNLRQPQALLRGYGLIHLSILAVVLCLGTVCGWLIARKFISGVLRVSEAARHIAGGDFSKRVPSCNDGVEIEELVSTFNMMNANTERLFDELRMVTDNVAHDLRTPLTRMRGFAEVTVSGPAELDRYKELAGVVADECAMMLQLINTMLEITRTESSLEKLDFEEIDLALLLYRAHELFLPLAEDREIDFRLVLPEAGPVMMRGDRLKLQRMISNLIDNALKFTPPQGRVTIRLERLETGIRLEVCDTGCGIPPQDLGHIFERFFRSDASRTRPGNGLGLALVHAIVTAHHGTIQVESTPGEGTVFTVDFPEEKKG